MTTTSSPSGTVIVVGGGPAGLMAAEVLATAGHRVTVFERMSSVGRKFLLAGRGGLNLTHSEPIDAFMDRYGPARAMLAASIASFGPEALQAWCRGLGQEPFVGSSGRVFPAALRSTPLLRAWLTRLGDLGVERRVRVTWQGWGDEPGTWTFVGPDGATEVVAAEAAVLALGGASWPRVGSDGAWVEPFRAAGIGVAPLRPANVGFRASWSETFRDRFAGHPVKNVRLTFGGAASRGDVVITDTGLEGGAVYGLSASLRDALEAGTPVTLVVDLRPDVSVGELTARLGRRRAKESTATVLRRCGVASVGIGLMREAHGRDLPAAPEALAALVKAVPVELVAPQSIERAISTAGGVAFADLDERFMVRARPGTFVAGEMLDWEAPTGGYLLQAAFATGAAAAHGALAWLDEQHGRSGDDPAPGDG